MRISGIFLIFRALAVLSAHLSEGTKALQSLGQKKRERKTQKSSLIRKQKVNKAVWDDEVRPLLIEGYFLKITVDELLREPRLRSCFMGDLQS